MEGILFTVDGTFKITPRKPKFYQLYTLRAVYGHVVSYRDNYYVLFVEIMKCTCCLNT